MISLKTEWIQVKASQADKDILEKLRIEMEEDSLSSTVRRLIRQEANRRGVLNHPQILPLPDDDLVAVAPV